MKKYIIALFLVISVLFGASNSFAQTGDVDPNPTASQCVSLQNNLRYRDRDINKNGEVSTLQDFLQSKGYLNSEPTGYFGLLTLKAVRDFQNANGILPVSGYVGPITKAKIKALTCGDYVPTVPPTTTTTPTPTTTNTNLPSGCLSGQNFSSTTGLACNGSQGTAFPAGCLSNQGYSPTTGKPCFSQLNPITPTITVLSPNGGQVYQAGQEVTIKWKTENIPGNTLIRIYRDWKRPDNSSNTQLTQRSVLLTTPNGYTINDGQETVVLPSLNDFNYEDLDLGRNFRIYIATQGMLEDNISSPSADDISDGFFTINSPTPTNPSITVLSPNGGESYKQGLPYTISWTTSNFGNLKIEISLVNTSGYVIKTIATDVLNIGNYSWIPDTSITPGSYKILIGSYDTGPSAQDYSDNFFTINASTITLQLGDVNGDGAINCTDVTWIQEAVLNTRTLTAEQKTRADMNGDGTISTFDAVLLTQQYGLNCGTIANSTTTCGTNQNVTVNGITYTLNPMTINETMIDGQGDKIFSTTIITPSSAVLYGFQVYGYGIGFPTYGIIGDATSGGASGNKTLTLRFKDSVLSADGNQPKVYSGCIPIGIYTGSATGNNISYLYLNINLTVNPSTPIAGDVNGDGAINCTDVTWIQEAVLNTRTLTAEQKARADMNGDGLITTADITKLIQVNGLSCGTTTPSTTLDSTPRIAYWQGKVGQHTDAQGNWISDPDGTSGVWDNDAGRLSYCKKWYPNTSTVQAYKTEIITTWKRAKYYEQSNYTNTVMTYKCIEALGALNNSSPLASIPPSSLSANVLGAIDGVSNTQNNTNTNTTTNTNTNTVRVFVCEEFTMVLSKGMNNDQVKCLQQRLNAKGYKVAGTEGDKEETTLFGWFTLGAVKAFQIANNLIPDGIFGAQSREVLLK